MMRLLGLRCGFVPYGLVCQVLFLGLLDLRDELLSKDDDRWRTAACAPARAALEADADVVAVSHLELPQTHVTAGDPPVGCRIEVLIRVAGVEPGRAEIAEMRLAAVADHVVAAVRLLRRYTARRARRGVQLHVFEGGEFLGRQLLLVPAWRAPEEFAVPRLVAAAAKGEAALFADSQQFLGWLVRLGCALAIGMVRLVFVLRV
jgi:hypothetical protein